MKYLFQIGLVALLCFIYSCSKDAGQEPVGDKPMDQEMQVTCTTGNVIDLTESTARLSGSVVLPEHFSGLTMAGILYSTSPEPDFRNATNLQYALSDDRSRFSFIMEIDGLPSSTTYYYVAYLKWNGQQFFGEVKSFTTNTFVTDIATDAATGVAEDKAVLHGYLAVKSILPLKHTVCFYYSSTESTVEGLIARGARVTSELSESCTFSYSLTKLNSHTTYYFLAGASVYDRTVYGEICSFTTLTVTASVTAADVGERGQNSARLNGNVIAYSRENLPKSAGFFYSMTCHSTEDLIASGTHAGATSIARNGDFSADISDLRSGITYYYIAYSRVHDQYFYSEVLSFVVPY